MLESSASAQEASPNAEGSSAAQAGAAAEVDTDGSAAARAAYEKGVALVVEKRFIDAQKEFEEAVRERPPLEAYYGLGQVELALGRPCRAIAAYNDYLSIGGARIPRDKRRGVEQHILQLKEAGASEEQCRPKAKEARLYLDCKTEGIEAKLDERDVALNQAAIFVAPGSHQVQFIKDNTPYARAEIELAAGDDLRLTCLEPISDQKGGLHPAPKPMSLRKKIAIGVTAGGVGFAVAALSHFFWNYGRHAGWKVGYDQFIEGGGTTAQAQAINDLSESVHRATYTTIGLAAAGGILTATGLTLLVLESRSTHSRPQGPESASLQALRASWTGNSATLSWSGTW